MFADLKVSTRLALAFGAVLLLLMAVIGVSLSRMAGINGNLRSITDERILSFRNAVSLRGNSFQMSVSVRDAMLSQDAAKAKDAATRVQEAMQNFEGGMVEFERRQATTAASEAEKAALEKVKEEWRALRPDI